MTPRAQDARHAFEVVQVVKSLKYGCDLAHFTHASNTIVYATNKEGKGHAICYMSLGDNKYLKYFNGHEQKVVRGKYLTLIIPSLGDESLGESCGGHNPEREPGQNGEAVRSEST